VSVEAKICGISDAEAMRMAVAAGAAYVGLVFYPPSPRNLTAKQACGLASLARAPVKKVGLFVDPDDATLAAVTMQVALDLIQLHGRETPERVAAVRAGFGLPVMKAIKVGSAEDVEAARAYEDAADLLLFDAKAPGARLPGGTGQSFDWTLLAGRTWRKPWMLSGGLDAANVAEAVRVTGARIVDVSSGVESAPGRKNPAAIRAFLDAVGRL
jgi:phosphoribosylanthranilate isomerase